MKKKTIKKSAKERFNPTGIHANDVLVTLEQLCIKVTNTTNSVQNIKLFNQIKPANPVILIENDLWVDSIEGYKFALKEFISKPFEYNRIFIECKNNRQFKKLITIIHRRASGVRVEIPVDISGRKKRKFNFTVNRNGSICVGTEFNFDLLPKTNILIIFERLKK